ncbi:4F5 family protein [Necator americanus]|uniref:4F5 family protein n=1 Tax=Necator americanus TaxID=51031 RepID=W2SYA2_NECAM|nr:4F5 family protein [Necator americanus]ETN73587.1 4F5 family protein [Necator americanus]
MTRGNQRDLAREKNMKKLMEQKKKAGAGAREANAGLSTDARMSRDAEVMRLKQEKAAAKKAAEDAAKAADAKKVKKIDPLKMLLLDSFMALGARCTILYWK